MKKFSLLILSVLLLSCSSDNNEDSVTKEGNFLDVYNGVAWRSGPDPGDCPWFAFSPEGTKTYECKEPFNGECNEFTNLWGVPDIEFGYIDTVLENSKNLLKLERVDSNGVSSIFSLSVSEDGNFLNYSNDAGETAKRYKASAPCK